MIGHVAAGSARPLSVHAYAAWIQTVPRRPPDAIARIHEAFCSSSAGNPVALALREELLHHVRQRPWRALTTQEVLESEVCIMSQRTVQLIIGQILTDEEFRSCFLDQPRATLIALRDRGMELTSVEIDALAQTDRRFWAVGAEWIDTRLQRCRLVGGASK
jgi:hypothetical protein